MDNEKTIQDFLEKNRTLGNVEGIIDIKYVDNNDDDNIVIKKINKEDTNE